MRSNRVPNLHKYSASYRWTTLREESSYMKRDFEKNADKVFIINTDQKRQIQDYWFQIKTNAKFGSESKVRLELGSWVNAARVLWTVLSVSTTAQHNRDQRSTVHPPPSIQIPAISLFCKKPSSRKPTWPIVYCRCSTTVLKSSAAVSAYLSQKYQPTAVQPQVLLFLPVMTLSLGLKFSI